MPFSSIFYKHIHRISIFNKSMMVVSASLMLYACQAKNSVVYVNTDQLLDTYQAMADARKQYQLQKQEWDHNLTTLQQEARAAIDTAQRLAQQLPVSARTQQATRARLRQQQFLNYRQAIAQQEGPEMERLTRPVLAQVNHFLQRYGKEHHYDLILATSSEGNLLYARPELDITKQVAAELNQALKDSLQAQRASGQ